MYKRLLATTALLASQYALAAQMEVEVEIPQLNVAEYHRPYVAIWIEQNGKHITDLSVWYDMKLRDNEGEKWLKDMRQWWRRSGRTLEFPVDGVSGATKAPGTHKLTFTSNEQHLAMLTQGEYQLIVEAAREVGGRELVRVPMSWPAQSTTTTTATGNSELGTVTLTITP